jgi:PAS domain S-box-containing protein
MNDENVKNTGSLKNSVLLFDDHQKTFVLSPFRLISTLAVSVFVVEMSVMAVLDIFNPPKHVETYFDASILTISLFIILYFYLFKPLVILINSYTQNKAELETQNEGLTRTRDELATARARYFDLYDLAPFGYITFCKRRLILEANLSVAAMLGVARDNLTQIELERFIPPEEQDIYNLHLNRVIETGEMQTWEMHLIRADGSLFWTQLQTALAHKGEYWITLNDISLRKKIEAYQIMSRDVLQKLNEPGDLQVSIHHAISVLKSQTGFDAVGIRLQEGDDFPYFAQEGFSKDHLLTENNLIGHDVDGAAWHGKDHKDCLECACGLVISGKTNPANPVVAQGGTFWTNDSFQLLEIPPGADPRLNPRNQCMIQGYASVALVPIRNKDRVIGLIQFNDRRKGCFTLESVEILEGIASHISSALMRKHAEEELKVYQSSLEQKVQERTAALNSAYLDLKVVNEETLKAKAALRESELRFRQLFEQSEDAIVLISPHDYAIIDVNHTAERTFRKNRAKLMVEGVTALSAPKSFNQLSSTIEQIIRDHAPGRIEKYDFSVDPKVVRFLSFRGKLITLHGVEIVYATFRDITTRVRLEEESREIQARLIQANRMTSLGTMVSSVAHEINNPNNFLLMNARIIKQAWDDIVPVVEEHFENKGDFAVAQLMWSEARSFLPEAFEGIQQGALRISDIVGNLKNYGRDDRFIRESVANVNDVVQLSVSILSHHISSSTRRFALELGQDLPLVKGSARQLEQVVINLIQNALLALPDKEHGVTVITKIDPESDHVLIRVADEGGGIPPEIAARIMEPFFTTRLEHGGTGLGLAISSTIVKEHGGSIEFRSKPGKGTTFTVRLCRAES